MKKTIEKLLLLLVCITCAVSLFSCGKKKPNDTNQNSSGTVVEKIIYSPTINAKLVLGEGVSARSISLIRSTYAETVGKDIEIVSASKEAASHEIIVGKTSRELSAKAYRALELAEHEDGYVGYVIYSDGNSVALAFDEASYGENVALATAIDDFVSLYMKNSSLKLGKGIVYYTSFDPMEKQAEREERTLNLLWELKLSQITEKTGGDKAVAESIVAELKKLYDTYNVDHSTVKWIANLYDPETGGFYYSNSARNNIGFLPDLESTSEALSIIELLLTDYGGTMTDYFGEEIAGKFVSFAKDMQDENGYFYHPQWAPELTDKNVAKRSRDVVNALSILGFFGAIPTYDTSNGVKGESTVSPVSKMTAPLMLNPTKSVAQLVSAQSDEIYIPNHLKTKESFESYLSGLNIKTNTSAVSEALYSEVPLYIAIDEVLAAEGASYRLTDILLKYLANNQNSSSGLWTSSSEDISDAISNVPGVIKIYNALGGAVTDYLDLLNTIISNIEALEEPDDITDVTSLWTAFYSVVSNLKTYSDETQIENVDFYLGQIYNNFDTLVRKTTANIALFAGTDGSFSTARESGTGEVMGMPIAIPGMDEGDISATLLAVKSLWLSIFGTLDLGCVPIFNASDRMTFQKTFLDLGIIIKNEIKSTDPIGFEEYDVGDTPTIRSQLNSSDSKMEIVNDEARESLAARLYSSKNKGAIFDFFYFDIMSSVTNASCYAYELDMCVLPGTSSGTFAQLYLFQDVHMISLKRSGNTVYFYENSSRSYEVNRTMDIGVTAEIGEWFKLRVEYYPAPGSSTRIKIYFNDECVVVSDNFFGSHKATATPATNYSSFCIYGYQKMDVDVLLDNVISETTYKTYTVETGRLNRNVDCPEKPQTIHGFESTGVGDTPIGFKPSGTAAGATVKNDSNGNRLLSLSENIGEIVLPLDSRGAAINSALVEFDFTLADGAKNGASYEISFNEYKYDNTAFGSMFILVKEENGTTYATVANGVSGKAGSVFENVKLYPGEKHRIGFHLFFAERAIAVSLDGKIVGINGDVGEITRYYLGEIKLISHTPSIDSEILLDNIVVEKAAASFDEVTAPEIDRVVGGFDSTDGMEFSGISPTGGKLSFESASGSASVKIPVNTRVESPSIMLIGFDVFASYDIPGELDVTLTDKSGNIIACLVLDSRDGEISLYERTKNGKYHTPIYTFKKSEFNLSIEYSPTRDDFNILVDGLYVAASSVTHTWESTEFDFEYLTVGCSGRSGFTIDNLYAEGTFGIFTSHGVGTPNLDPVDGKFTFETSSFASLPSKIERILGNATASHKVREADIKGEVSKVLEMHLGTGAGSTFSIFQKSDVQTGKNAVFFESDVMLKHTTTNLYILFEIQSNANGAVSLAFTGTGEGKPLSFLGTELGVKEGEWFKLRIEYRDTPHDFNYDGKNDILARVFIDGELVAESHTPASSSTTVKASDVSKIRIRNSSGRAGIVYLDNTVLGDCDMSYTPPVPPDTDTLTFEPGVINKKIEKSLGAGSTLSVVDMTVAGQVSKVLELVSAKNAADKLDILVTESLENANALCFETDIMISPTSDTVAFTLEPLTSKEKQPFVLNFTANKNGKVVIFAKGIAETEIGNSGEWIHLKIEYMNPNLDYDGDGERDILLKIYIGNSLTPTVVGLTPYSSSSHYDSLKLERFRFKFTSETEAKIYLDNTKFWQINLTPDEGGTEPVEKDDESIGDGNFGKDDWA